MTNILILSTRMILFHMVQVPICSCDCQGVSPSSMTSCIRTPFGRPKDVPLLQKQTVFKRPLRTVFRRLPSIVFRRPFTIHSGRPITVHSGRPITVHSGCPITVHSERQMSLFQTFFERPRRTSHVSIFPQKTSPKRCSDISSCPLSPYSKTSLNKFLYFNIAIYRFTVTRPPPPHNQGRHTCYLNAQLI